MSIRAVIFDFGNVVCLSPTEEQWAEAAQFCRVDVAEYKRVFWLTRDNYDRGEDPAAYWPNFARITGRVFDDAMIAGLAHREVAFWSHFDMRVSRTCPHRSPMLFGQHPVFSITSIKSHSPVNWASSNRTLKSIGMPSRTLRSRPRTDCLSMTVLKTSRAPGPLACVPSYSQPGRNFANRTSRATGCRNHR